MKRYIYILFLICLVATTQAQVRIGQRQPNNSKGITFKELAADSLLRLPHDTLQLLVRDSGSLAIKNNNIFLWTGYIWKKTSSDSSGNTIIGGDTLSSVNIKKLSGLSTKVFNVKDYGALGDGATNDQSAIQATINAAAAARGGTVYFPAGRYIVSGALQDVGNSNSQLVLPAVPLDSPTVVITLQGDIVPPTQLFTWSTTPGPAAYSILKSTLTGATGTAACIAGPSSDYLAADQNNVVLNIDKMIFEAPPNPTFTMLNLQNQQGNEITNTLVHASNIHINTVLEPTHPNAFGVKLPDYSHSARTVIDFHVIGFYTGVRLAESIVSPTLRVYACHYAVEAPFSYHPAQFSHLQIAWCPYGIVATNNNNPGAPYDTTFQLTISILDMEHANGEGSPWQNNIADVYDPNNYLRGDATYVSISSALGKDHNFKLIGGKYFLTHEIGYDAARLSVTNKTDSARAPLGVFNQTKSSSVSSIVVGNAPNTEDLSLNVMAMGVHGTTYPFDDYLSDGAPDARLGFLVGQGTNMDNMVVGAYNNASLYLMNNNRVRMGLTLDSTISIYRPLKVNRGFTFGALRNIDPIARFEDTSLSPTIVVNQTKKDRTSASVVSHSNASNAWDLNFITTAIKGDSVDNTYDYLSDGVNDSRLAIISGQGSNMAAMAMGTYNNAPLHLMQNNKIRISFYDSLVRVVRPIIMDSLVTSKFAMLISKEGGNTIGVGPLLGFTNSANTRAQYLQLNTRSGLDFWRLDTVLGFQRSMTIENGGFVGYPSGYLHGNLKDSSFTDKHYVDSIVSTVGGGGGTPLPSQTGQAGKYLTTNGTSASWATVTGSGSIDSSNFAKLNGANTFTNTNNSFPTAAFNDSTNKPATTAFVDRAVAADSGTFTISASNGITATKSRDTLYLTGSGSTTIIDSSNFAKLNQANNFAGNQMIVSGTNTTSGRSNLLSGNHHYTYFGTTGDFLDVTPSMMANLYHYQGLYIRNDPGGSNPSVFIEAFNPAQPAMVNKAASGQTANINATIIGTDTVSGTTKQGVIISQNSVVTVTSAYTVPITIGTVICNMSDSNQLLTLPPATSFKNRAITINNRSALKYRLYLESGSGFLWHPGVSARRTVPYDRYVTVQSDGTNWQYKSSNYVLIQGTQLWNQDMPLEYADNAGALSGGLVPGDTYRTGDVLKTVHY